MVLITGVCTSTGVHTDVYTGICTSSSDGANRHQCDFQIQPIGQRQLQLQHLDRRLESLHLIGQVRHRHRHDSQRNLQRGIQHCLRHYHLGLVQLCKGWIGNLFRRFHAVRS
ncbi:hypothetical protein CROQUDRAFT_426033 [Cronartium quercuum f. sp. fusiforme G11]|uniref:Uncharacterized protein n=1 Tax=Cronartium quercuum f. sp. fusiforme G11 TaxID=708437 RepID=A0A9P6TDD9_9BASI|nr:hypothetical protein CROQUDRAFT_426033 [Cronartium quercuum f. sp. fusiforme G11]